MPSETEILLKGAEEMNKAIAEEFVKQGHHLTGFAERSLHAEVMKKKNETTVTGTAVDYMLELDDYVPGYQIGIDQASIDAMTRYVELRMGYKGKQAIKVAILILEKQQKEGRPTKASSQYSQTGERTEFIEAADLEQSNKSNEIISDGLDDMMEEYFSQQQNEIV